MVLYRIAISYVSIENARQNLNSSELAWDFEGVVAQTENEWDYRLSKIEVRSEDADREVQFYTHLYHSLIHPNIVSDVNG